METANINYRAVRTSAGWPAPRRVGELESDCNPNICFIRRYIIVCIYSSTVDRSRRRTTTKEGKGTIAAIVSPSVLLVFSYFAFANAGHLLRSDAEKWHLRIYLKKERDKLITDAFESWKRNAKAAIGKQDTIGDVDDAHGRRSIFISLSIWNDSNWFEIDLKFIKIQL